MSSLSAVEAQRDWRRAPESLQALIVVCLEELADLARAHGQPRRAARLLDAAALLRDQQTGVAEPNPLTRREWEVAGLVSRGLSNRQIAEQLVLSEGTVANHVQEILQRLGLRSRTQLAVWIAAHARGSA